MILETMKSIMVWKYELIEKVKVEKTQILTKELKINLFKNFSKLKLFFPIFLHFIIAIAMIFAIYSKYLNIK